MSANPHANGGLLTRPLRLPDFRDRAVEVSEPGGSIHEPTRVLGEYLIDVVRDNPTNFRIFGPDETASNRLNPVWSTPEGGLDSGPASTVTTCRPCGTGSGPRVVNRPRRASPSVTAAASTSADF